VGERVGVHEAVVEHHVRGGEGYRVDRFAEHYGEKDRARIIGIGVGSCLVHGYCRTNINISHSHRHPKISQGLLNNFNIFINIARIRRLIH
jgi:hypothetical protein